MTTEEKAKAYDKALEKARLLCAYPTTKPFISDLQDLFPELTESEDERIRKALRERIINYDPNNEILIKEEGISQKQFLAWIEKQGEQKPTDTCDSSIINDKEFPASEKRDFGYFSELADNTEPKFKVGDWIICCDYEPVQIISIRTNAYEMSNGDIRPFYMIDNNHNIRPWTIQDAKDGDVLLSPSTPEGDKECPFIFKEIDKNGIVRCHAALLQSESLKIDDGITNVMGYANADYHIPATEEQRDLLFQKMREASYEWDREKKELKKIDDEEYNGEDYGIDGLFHAQRILEKTLGAVDGYQSDDGILEHKCAISAVKKLYKQKPTQGIEPFEAEHGKYYYCIKDYFCNGKKHASKGDVVQALKGLPIMGLKDASEYFLPVNFIKCYSAWSEEDEEQLDRAVYMMEQLDMTKSWDDVYNWLKFLKERVQPKVEWSEEDEKIWNKAKQIFPESLNMQSGYVTGYKDALL